ncbi:MAG TPA: GTP pyrophosphokinase [Marinilabiliales bacterium]|nr:MAG: GTP pyrophosphokinase [Bacteroidetes bacterium GWA2_40_14]OFX60574.1 MAG: GTP pyrophosphokinase [Bacteroidetes bacterium GWC2_40_13]OFX71103.1 MAG: GTP pyrophosphokinase [Bacteroidetes bacterium GWD2_40_43]OFX92414.1 MAG: GTP pyrophosphokinase [Bacteroidetes bacterium GWE2_40_63]OFY23016.1 MAG: GTP pyrophosphokinase [Bacteroidetes bacterium GWF2_40_13]OFZ29894.1 MAG: GTP pyrophosphokinase [Bacteroidetes bacterium RIFOXYC2_FULL_40_12]HAM99230.1 GTP pyrophosphokinase [Marinilabiliales b
MKKFTVNEKKLILRKFNELLQLTESFTTAEQRELIRKAFNMAYEAHANMRRKSGEPYILHPIAVAKIATHEIGLGTKSVLASLLHDVVEDTDISIEEIQHQFGEKIASLVDGLTKISGVFANRSDLQAENFRKVLMTMTGDLRVIIIKLADRLHNMRTLDSMPPNKQLKIAGETLFIYAPLAHRMGLYAIKQELEDLCLKYLHPAEYDYILQQIKETEKGRLTYINRFSLPITNRLNEEGYEFEISGRPKSIYSIWNKMETKKVSFEEVFDLFAIRIIFEPKPNLTEKAQCWNIYSIVTDLYVPKYDRIRDWVSQPKANGYEALHATVMGPGGKWVEVQIRTNRMNEIAERGYAAHWKYKGASHQESELDRWIKQIREMLEDPKSDALEFLDDFKLNLFTSEIMVFTPKGEIITLPSASTALDFAFYIHSEIGLHAIGAKVNHKLVGLNHPLQGGDQIEILTSQKQMPELHWLDFVTSAKAKAKLKSSFRDKRRMIMNEGKAHLEYLLMDLDMQPNSTVFRKLYNHYKTRNKEELYFRIGEDKLDQETFKKIQKKRSRSKYIKFWGIEHPESTNAALMFDKSKPLVVDDNSKNYTIAHCCNPIPGDDVIGYKADEEELIIHKTSCPTAIRLNSSESQNVVKVEWTTHRILAFLGRISLKGIDDIGIVNNCTTVISKELNVNMRAIGFESHDGIFEGTIDVYVHNTNDLNNLIMNLSKVKGITQVSRMEISDHDF